MNEPAPKILELKNIVRTFGEGKRALEVLRGANLEVRAGEVVALVGPSGPASRPCCKLQITRSPQQW